MTSPTGGEAKGPWWLSALAGLLMLSAFPLGFGPKNWLGPPAAITSPGDPLVNLVTLAAMIATVVAAVILALAARRPRMPAALALLPFLAPFLVALSRNQANRPAVVAAFSQATHGDRVSAYFATVAGLFEANVLALSFATTACGAIAMASALMLLVTRLPMRLISLFGVGLLGASLAMTLQQTLAIRNLFATAPQPAAFQELISGQSVLPVVFLSASLIVSLAVALRTDRSAFPLLAAAVIALQAFVVITDRSLFADPGLVDVDADLNRFDGHAPIGFLSMEMIPEADVLDDQVHTSTSSALAQGWLGLELRDGQPADRVLRIIQVLHLSEASFEFTGRTTKGPIEVPARFAALAKVWSGKPSSAPMRIVFEGEDCANCKGVATIKSEGLEVLIGGSPLAWMADAIAYEDDVTKFPGVEFRWTGNVAELVRASLIALSHRHLLVVRVPRPDPMPEFAADEDEGLSQDELEAIRREANRLEESGE